MILLGLGAQMLARLMRADPRGPDTAWLLEGPSALAVEPAQSISREPCAEVWPLAAE